MGVLLAVIAAFFLSAKDLVSKGVAGKVDGAASAFASFAFAIPFYLLLLIGLYLAGIEDFSFNTKFQWVVLARAVTDVGAELLKMLAFSYADISVVTCIFALYPVLLLGVAPLVAGDEVGEGAIISVLLGVAGSMVLLYDGKRHALTAQRKGIIFAFCSAIFFALNSSLDRLAVQQASPALSGFSMTVLSCLFLAPLVIFSRRRQAMCRTNAKAFSLRGGFEVGFMVIKLWALQYLTAPIVVSIQKISVLFSIVGGRVLYKEEDFWRRMVAGILILLGVIIAALL